MGDEDKLFAGRDVAMWISDALIVSAVPSETICQKQKVVDPFESTTYAMVRGDRWKRTYHHAGRISV